MNETERVEEHLKILSVLYYVNAALHLVGTCFGLVYVAMAVFMREAILAAPERQPEAEQFADLFSGVFALVGVGIGCFAIAGAVCSFLSARWMTQRRNRTFSLVVAALTCLNVPLGTILGVFTFIVLTKSETEALYASAERGDASAA